MRIALIFLFIFGPFFASAAVFINEVQISGVKERFIELYNSDSSDVDLTGWYIQRKTATGASFGSLVSSTVLSGKTIKAQDYFLISRSQLNNSDVVAADLTLTESNTVRIRDSKGKDVDQIMWGSIDDGKSYQRTSSNSWSIGSPTPGVINSVSQNVTTETTQTSSSQENVLVAAAPQVTAQASPQTRVVLAGAPIIFEGNVAGLENSFGGATQTTWTFGDGSSAAGSSVTHTYYYPGEYTAILDIVSGNLTARDRMLVRVVLPNLFLRTGGDTIRSFITIQNNGGDELDISGWQVVAGEKTFTFPKNTILGARKNVTFASEVTGLTTPSGSAVELLFPNGSHVDIKEEKVASPDSIIESTHQNFSKKNLGGQGKPKVVVSTTSHAVLQEPQRQEASIVNSVSERPDPVRDERGLWPWYIGVAFLGAFALIGVRLTQNKGEKGIITAEDFEIIEEVDDTEPH